MDRKQQPNQVLAPAQAALEYYRSHGFFKPAAYSAILLVRAHRDKGEYAEAFQSGSASLDVATRSGDRRLQFLSHETVGSTYEEIEDFPRALQHFELAREFADTPENTERESERCAQVLWQLGRYVESDVLLKTPSIDAKIRLTQEKTRLASLLSQGKYSEALAKANTLVIDAATTDPNDRRDIRLAQTLAEAHLHHRSETKNKIESLAPSRDDASQYWTFELAAAEVELYSGDLSKARETAAQAEAYFSSKNKPISELRSLWLLGSTAKQLGDVEGLKRASEKMIDISANLQQNWGSQAFQTFASRPDAKARLE